MSDVAVRRVARVEEIQAVADATAAAGHSCIEPTHIVEMDGRTVGYASVGKVTFLTGWLHKDVPQPMARQVVRDLEGEAAQGLVVMPCTADCRFLHDMKQMG